jgi:transposase
MVLNGYSYSYIGKNLNVSRQIVSIWYNNIKNNIDIFQKRLKNNINNIDTLKYSTNIINYTIELVYKYPFICRKDIIDNIKYKFNIILTKKNITKLYKIANLTRKKTKNLICKNLSYLDELKIKRNNFIDIINKIDKTKIISIDESNFNTKNNNRKGSTVKGNNIYIPVTQGRLTKLSLLMALTSNDVIHNIIINKSVNSNIFFNFIQEIIIKLGNIKGYIFLFDNVNFHKSIKIKELIESNGHSIIFSPPYSPNNNPIEYSFSLIKKNYYNEINMISYEKRNNIIIRKEIINKSINNFINNNKDNIYKLFNRAFQYTYNIEENQLRDRILFTNNNYLTIIG